jgi:hypothetical protein
MAVDVKLLQGEIENNIKELSNLLENTKLMYVPIGVVSALRVVKELLKAACYVLDSSLNVAGLK